MPPLRIAHVTNEPFGPESANGVQQAVYCLARAQAALGAPVAVFSREAGTFRLDASVDLPAGSLAGSRTPSPSMRQRLLAGYFEDRLARDIAAWRPAIVHLHSIHIPRNVALAAHLRTTLGIPYCVTVHGGLHPAALRRGGLKKALFSRLFERQYLNDAAFVHALSEEEAGVMRRHGISQRLVVVPNGLPPGAGDSPTDADALFAAHPSLRGRRVFMYVGRLDIWQKGLDLLLDAFALARLPGAGLVLVGPDWRGAHRTLSARAGRLGIADRVVFTGPAFGQDRANLLAASDVFVHPSRWEGVSLAVLTAAAAGRACLVTRAADPLGALERAGAAIVVEARVSSIAEGLSRAAALRREDLLAMGARARAVPEGQFAWPAIAGAMLAAYRGAVEGNHAGARSGRPVHCGASPGGP